MRGGGCREWKNVQSHGDVNVRGGGDLKMMWNKAREAGKGQITKGLRCLLRKESTQQF